MFYERFESNRDYQIRKQVTNLLRKLNIKPNKEIDLSKIIHKIDDSITWQLVDLYGLPGFTCFNKKKQKYRLFLDKKTYEKCLARIRFTIAHELGHIVLKHFGMYEDSTYIINKKHEYEANIFADELLMPTLPILNKKMTVDEVCNTYLVSKSAAHNKLYFINRNTLYREEKQERTIRFSFMEFLNHPWCSNPDEEDYQFDGISFSENNDEYNEKVIGACLDRWLEPD